jgi:hypothetical protein
MVKSFYFLRLTALAPKSANQGSGRSPLPNSLSPLIKSGLNGGDQDPGTARLLWRSPSTTSSNRCTRQEYYPALPAKFNWVAETTTTTQTSSAPVTNSATSSSTPSEINVTTQIIGDRQKVSAQLQGMITNPLLLGAGTTHFSQDSIKDFLKKYVDLTEFTIATTDAALTEIASFDLPQDILQPMYTNKLDGFQGFRPRKVKFLVVSSANEYQQGRLMAVWLPMTEQQAISMTNARLTNLTTVTQLPRVEMDINCDSAMEIEIPYVSPALFYDFAGITGGYGTLKILVYSPLKSGTGSNTFTIHVYACIEEADLVNPAVTDLALRSRKIKYTGRAQMKGTSKAKRAPRSPAEQEANTGMISGPLNLMSRMARSLAGIPELTLVAEPAAWVLKGLSSVLGKFGYSSPRVNDYMLPSLNPSRPFFQNSDAPHTDVKALALKPDNAVTRCAFAGTDLDETATKFLYSRAAHFETITWGANQAVGSLLLAYDMCPQFFNVLAGTAAGIQDVHTAAPFAYLAFLAHWWRGAIRFIFKLSKTQIHIGSLCLGWFPGATNPGSLEDCRYVHNALIDVSKGNEFTFDVPFSSFFPWMDTGASTGQLCLFINTALTGPSTVSSTVDIQVEVCGGPDFKLGWFGPTAVTPFIPFYGDVEKQPRIKKGMVQVGHAQMDAGCKINAPEAIGNSSVGPEDNLSPEQLCIGEEVASIRSLLQRFTRPQFPTQDYPITVRPQVAGIVSENEDQDNWVFPPLWGDYWSLLSTMYTFHRGGMRLALGTTDGGAAAKLIASLNQTTGTTVIGNANNAITTQRGESYQQLNAQFNMLVETPQYSRSVMSVLRPAFSSVSYSDANTTSSLNDIYSQETQVQAYAENNTSLQVLLHRAIAEDCQLGGFVGVLPFVTATPVIPAIPPLGDMRPQAFAMGPQDLRTAALPPRPSEKEARARPREGYVPQTSDSMARINTQKSPITDQEYAALERQNVSSPHPQKGSGKQTYDH